MGRHKHISQILTAAALISLSAYQAEPISPGALGQGSKPQQSPQDELEIGKLYYETDEFPSAIEHFSNAIKADSQNGRLYYERAHAYYKLDQYIQAIPDYTTSLRLKYSPSLNYERRAYCFLNNRQYKKGIEDCTKAIEADPLSRVAYYNRGKAYGLVGEAEKSKKDFEKIKQLDKNPRSKDLYDRCHLVHNSEGRVKLCSEAVKLDPKNAEAWLLLGSSYLDLNKSKEALNCFNKLVALNAKDLTAYMNRGTCEMSFSKFNEAIKDLNLVLSHAEDCYSALYLRGQCLVHINKIKEGQADYKRAIDLMQKKMTSEHAKKNLEYRKMLGRNLASTFTLSAEAWEKAGDINKAIDDMTCAINGCRMAPEKLAELLPQRAALYKKANRTQEMHQDLLEAKAVSDKIEAIRRGPYIPPPPVSSYSDPKDKNTKGVPATQPKAVPD